MSAKRYTEEFKIEAVKQVTERCHPVAAVANRLGVSGDSLYRMKQYSAAGILHNTNYTKYWQFPHRCVSGLNYRNDRLSMVFLRVAQADHGQSSCNDDGSDTGRSIAADRHRSISTASCMRPRIALPSLDRSCPVRRRRAF
jgi:hypothetical protein